MILLSFAYAKLSSIIPPPRKCQEKVSEKTTAPTRPAYGGFRTPLIYASAQSDLIKSEILVKSYLFLLT